MSAVYTSHAEYVDAATARAHARKEAKSMGVIIETRFDGGWHEILLTAPDGKKFMQADLHEVVIANAGPTTDGLWQRALKALSEDDMIVCSDSECEWCHEDDASDAIKPHVFVADPNWCDCCSVCGDSEALHEVQS